MDPELPKKFDENDGSQEDLAPEELAPETDTSIDDIEPAEFFDPEEFGYRRLGSRPINLRQPRPWVA